MRSRTVGRFWALHDRLPDQVQRAARRQFQRFRDDPSHPSLQFKKIGGSEEMWSARINNDYCAVGLRDGDIIYWYWIGPHAEYDKLLPGE